ncbi:valine--tRNA ligase [Candidatus Methylacidithermus pantelleriae]|uniref:Valine--tRNA ligase n=1 Tax=Candidatus Methylacidithermus pantelleriae TaxID=2744239 RepID=A0A8J2FNL6_9BACT|nr:valine--tRNA ligase [Candidatus Methylacidithermus pantelleriae]CAF0696401.1 Valine--tRNA ligase [Candidatus Methylacidithermus pantelleriae]
MDLVIPSQYDAAGCEAKWRQRWEEWGVYRFDPTRPRSENFVIDTPPPTVSGSLHVGHVFSYTHQDLVARYQRMRGRNVFYPMGWDDNGLPTERRVQNHFRIRCDPSVPYEPNLVLEPQESGPWRKVSRKNFIEACHILTRMDEQGYKELWQRLGLSVDWSLEYSTIGEKARRISQLSVLRLLEKGEVYQATFPVFWDVTFGTAVAQAEIEERECPGFMYHLRFGLTDDRFFVVATTRPELLAACVAVMVHPDDPRHGHLVGQVALTPLFAAPVPVLADRRVQPEKGTGIVMVCTFGDATDVEWWREYRLPLRQLLSPEGTVQLVHFGGASGWPSRDPDKANRIMQKLAGLDVERARHQIVQLLAEEGSLVGEPVPLVHAVKFYEKGDRPLEILPAKQWFIRLLDKKEELLRVAETIQWHPPHMLERYRAWVEGLSQDWCISRQRYFGVPFPVWYRCDEKGNPIYDQLLLPRKEELPVDPASDVPPGFRPEQRGTPNGFAPETDVLDTWATSGLTPLLCSGWDLEGSLHGQIFPMDLRPQAHEIIRTWAFYTIALVWMHQRTRPWHHVLISGWVLDPTRAKMSKSKGQVIVPSFLLEQYSADAVRYWAGRAKAGVDTTYDESMFRVGRRLMTKLWNAGRFVFSILSEVPRDKLHTAEVCRELDRGFLDKLRAVLKEAEQAFEQYDWSRALSAVENFFWWDFCDNYLEIIKERVYSREWTAGRGSALRVLDTCFSILLRLFAPFLPHLCEELWSYRYAESHGRRRSIHTSPWPTVEELEGFPYPCEAGSYEFALQGLSEVRKSKALAKRSVKWPVRDLVVRLPKPLPDPVQEAVKDIQFAAVAERISVEIVPDLVEPQWVVHLAEPADRG